MLIHQEKPIKVGPVQNDQVSDQVENQDIQNKILEYCRVARSKKEISGYIGYKI